MTIPKVHLKNEPFPHAIVENFYNTEELHFIWQELEFLTSPNKMIMSSENLHTVFDSITNLPKANNHGIVLDDIYSNRQISDILTITQKLFYPDLLQVFADLHPLMGHATSVKRSITKVRYYENNEHYLPHQDDARFTSVSYFYKEPKVFEGGNLFFNKFNYTIEIQNNMMVFFCGAITHSSTEIKMNGFNKFSGYGKYAITKHLDL
jgi:Rps23 Pro-64 3,4-dihydroxylase Tpa1-like proline 4-hydroxylase